MVVLIYMIGFVLPPSLPSFLPLSLVLFETSPGWSQSLDPQSHISLDYGHAGYKVMTGTWHPVDGC